MAEQTIASPASPSSPSLTKSSGSHGSRTWNQSSKAAIDATRGGVWAWLFQRITAGVLIFGRGSHLVATRIMAIGELSDSNIAQRLASAFFVVVDVSLLAAALYHALNGVRMVVFDYWFRARFSRAVLAAALWAIGVIFFVYGMWALWPWITAK